MNSPITIRLPGFPLAAEDIASASAPTSVALAAEASPSDESLMAQIRGGSKEALAILFRRYARLVRTVAVRILRDDSEADDLLQDLFLFIFRNCSIFDPARAAARSWIVQMTYHRAIDRKRYLNSRHFYTRQDLDSAADLLDPHSYGREEADSFTSLVGNTTIHGLLDTLSEDQRNTLSLHFFEGFTLNEVAVRLNQSLGNIRNHYYRGLEKLRKQVFAGRLPGSNVWGRK